MKILRKRILAVLLSVVMTATMLVGAPISAKAAYGDYNAGDIAVIENMIDNNGLSLVKASTQAPASVDDAWMTANWPEVTWSVSLSPGDTNRRIVELGFNGRGLTGVLDLSGLDALEDLDCANNNLTALDLTGLSSFRNLNCSYNFMTDPSKVIDAVNTALPAPADSGYFMFFPQNFFALNNGFDVPAGYVNTAITSIDVSGGVYHGTSPYTYSISAGPSWLAINSTTGVITGTRPATGQPATTATITVTDSAATPATDTIVITVGAVTPFVCMIVETLAPYPTIDNALAAVTNGQTIRLLVDVTLADDLTIDNGETFTFDTNGNELVFGGNGLIIENASKVNFTGCAEFKNLDWVYVYDDDTSAEFDSALVMDGLFHAEGKVEVVINGSLTVQNGASDGIQAMDGAKVTIKGDVSAGWYGVGATGGSSVTVEGDIIADSGMFVRNSIVIVKGDIIAEGEGVIADSGSVVEVEGFISALMGVYAFGEEISITVVGNIYAGAIGIRIDSPEDVLSSDIEIVVTGNITAGDKEYGGDVYGVGILAVECDGLTINVGGDIDAFFAGAIVGPCFNTLVSIAGNITAGYLGAMALFDVQIFIGKSIVVTSAVPYEADDILVGAASGFGGEITIDGTITAVNYVALYFELDWDPDANEGYGDWVFSFIYVNANENFTPTSKPGYLEYNDSDADAAQWIASFVWVKAATTPGTGDGTALWLLLGALMAAALGTGAVFAYRRRRQED